MRIVAFFGLITSGSGDSAIVIDGESGSEAVARFYLGTIFEAGFLVFIRPRARVSSVLVFGALIFSEVMSSFLESQVGSILVVAGPRNIFALVALLAPHAEGRGVIFAVAEVGAVLPRPHVQFLLRGISAGVHGEAGFFLDEGVDTSAVRELLGW